MSVARFIGWLLWHANADPGVHRQDFYALKDRLLKRYGRVVGEDVQRIRKQCWGSYQEGCRGAKCDHCAGTGIWETRWVLLERWDLAGRIFHRPVGPARPRAVDFIDGRIVHTPRNYRTSRDAHLWLALLFDRRLFRRLLRSSRSSGWQWRPMLALQALVFEVHRWLSVRECWCGRRFLAMRTGWQSCAQCRTSWKAYAAAGDEDLPF